ncbi:MAG: hypothetical protein AB7Q29_16040 [Vicinamibacterales bacterium]
MAPAVMQRVTPFAAGRAPAAKPLLSPQPYKNEADRTGPVSRESIAREVYEAHKNGLQSRRERDLLSEMYALHIDGAADFQWAVISRGGKVEIPREVAEFRKSENLLGLVVANAIAYHTTMPLRYLAEAGHDRESRDRATIDTLWSNHLAQVQDFNGLFAEALSLAMPMGFCPVHAYWREDVPIDWYEPTAYGDGQEQPNHLLKNPLPAGMIDCFVGNPWGTVFDASARRGSCRWSSYERWVPLASVKEQFSHVPGVADLQGTTKMPSSAEIQQIAREWLMGDIGHHGSWVISDRHDKNEEMVLLICREEAPRGRTDPFGRLRIIAVPGTADPRKGKGKAESCVLLADQVLPGRDFSWTNFYSGTRGSDIHGKPWVEDLDQMQVDLNLALSKRWEVVHRQVEAPIVAPGGAISEDMADVGAYQVLEIDPGLGNWRPRVMEWPQGILPSLDKIITELRQGIYTIGGYQAASRGEAPGSRTAYRAIVALQQADRSIHGPVNMRFQRGACDFMRRCWSQMKMYGHTPWLLSVVGADYDHLVEWYVDRSQLSHQPPQFKLTNSFGSTPDARAQELLQLMAIRGADGQPFITTEEVRRLWPSPLGFSPDDPTPVKRRRARTIAKKIHHLASQYRQQKGIEEQDRAHPNVQQAGLEVFYQAETLFPRDRADMLEAHIASLEEITQDETADPIARIAARYRLEMYYQWQAAMSAIPMPGASGQSGSAPGRATVDRAGVAQDMEGGGAGTTLQDTDEA